MANPNRTVASWRNSNPTLERVKTVICKNHFEAEILADELRETGEFDKVAAARFRVGPRNQRLFQHEVRCWKKL